MVENFLFVGEAAAIDFVNTEIAVAGESRDLLQNYGDLVRWSVESGLTTAAQADSLSRFDGTSAGETALRRACALRAQLRAAMRVLAAGERVDLGAVSLLNELLKSCRGHLEMELSQDSAPFQLRYEMLLSDPLQLVAHIAQSAARLLCSGDVAHVKGCENPDCVLMFLDVSKNKKRRWCSMAKCGNRHKVASHRRRRERAEQADIGKNSNLK